MAWISRVPRVRHSDEKGEHQVLHIDSPAYPGCELRTPMPINGAEGCSICGSWLVRKSQVVEVRSSSRDSQSCRDLQEQVRSITGGDMQEGSCNSRSTQTKEDSFRRVDRGFESRAFPRETRHQILSDATSCS